ncbi:hypothetical protein [Pseudoflavonifractor capillosus]|uniref:Uncharacterized protein n=1 Tax=Pseudoflavonifractor capillosus TaxID=106588 RepID=A0A921MNE5_9FIRM|nr:hypothetical protein [Pseudoflavonifractor capillosus]HJG87310.1 hypothetical protein [Pseudoflavonifractor capillosus]
MKKIATKTISLVSIISILLNTTVFAVETSKEELLSTPSEIYTYEQFETAISQAEEEIHQQYYDALEDALDNNNIVNYNQLAHAMAIERSLAVEDVLREFGFEKITNGTNITPMSSSNDLSWTAEDAYYNPSEDIYVYTVDWEFAWAKWDELYDIPDLVGVSMTNPDDYYILKAYAKTWDSTGKESGYVDEYGNGASDSKISKRAEDAEGVIYDVIDMASYLSAPHCTASQGRITLVVKQKVGTTGTPQNKFIASYEHNYKEGTLEIGAEVESAGFSSITGLLKVSYKIENKNWLRASGGKVIGA